MSDLSTLNELKRLEVRMGDVKVGQLRWHERTLYFSYTEGFFKRDLWLSPFQLPLRSELFEHRDLRFGPLFGLFDDSLPDGWGRLLISRHFRSRGLELRGASPLALLAYLGDRTMGALSYHPPRMDGAQGEAIELALLARHSQELLSGAVEDVLPALRRAGGSPGGARPKILVGVRQDGTEGPALISGEGRLPSTHAPWLIKFRGADDDADAPRVELAYMELARSAGLRVPATRAFEAEGSIYFGVERFDRVWGEGEWRRVHIHTLGGLIHADFRVPSCDYADLLKVTRALTRGDQEALYQAFRIMVFNWLTHNRDDHVKNISFMMSEEGEWSLAPVYDLTWSSGLSGEHSMTIAGEGRAPKASHALKLCRDFDLDEERCLRVIDEVGEAVARWGEVSSSFSVSARGRARIQRELNRLWGDR